MFNINNITKLRRIQYLAKKSKIFIKSYANIISPVDTLLAGFAEFLYKKHIILRFYIFNYAIYALLLNLLFVRSQNAHFCSILSVL